MERRATICATALLLACCPCASALNPSLDINQYAHTAWTVREGFFKGYISSIAQTPDGYLWVGTEFGLLRFDGVRSTPFQPPAGEQLPSSAIQGLLTARDGRLWIGTSKGLASWKNGKLTHYPELAGHSVVKLLQDREGTVWVGSVGPAGRLCAIQSRSAQCYGEDGSLGAGVFSLYEDKGGNLWAGAGTGLWRWKHGAPKLYPMPEPVQDLIEGDNGALLMTMPSGIRQLIEGKPEVCTPSGAGRQFRPLRFLRDRDAGLWIGTTDRGLLHVHQGRTNEFTKADGLSSDFIRALLEDREGNIWVATSDGLDRFREFAIPKISVKQGLSSATVESVLAARDGSIWFGTNDRLNRWNDGQITIYSKRNGLPDDEVHALFQDDHGRIWVSTFRGVAYFENGRFIPMSGVPGGYVHSMAGDSGGNLWISHQVQGLFHLLGGNAVERIPWARLGHKDPALALTPEPTQGGLWLGFFEGGAAYYKDGQIRASYAVTDGLGEGRVTGLQLDRDGTLWAATEGGLSRLKNGRIATLVSRNGLPCNMVHWMLEDDAQSLWLGMACGLVRIARRELDAWVTDPKRKVQVTVFDIFDGVSSHSSPSAYGPRVDKSADGRLWFLSFDGVSVIDPAHLPFNKLPPPVHIEQIIADRKPHEASAHLRLPALSRDLQIDYTALSLVAPEKNHFKYRLEGHDADWVDAGNRRQAFYNDLPPREYRFRVVASNNSGLWNETGDTLEFSIAPAYYQTNWFRALVAAAVLVLIGMGYQLRVWRLQREAGRLRDVIETIPAYVWSALPDGFVDFVNRRWLEFSGFSLDQAKGWGWAGAVHPEDRGRLLEAFRTAIASGKALEEEARMRGADGQYRWLLFRSVPQRDQSGKIVKWYGKSMDIDDRKRAEETLRETEMRFRTYIDHATDAFLVLDFEGGTILDVNRRACENLGYTREELIGKTVFEFEAGLDPEWLERNIRPRIEAGESVTFETQHRRKDGSVFPVEIRARAFQTGGRTVNLSLVQDITERKRAEEERERLRQMEIDLAHINRVSMMGELAASVAHEVNQPLAGIVSNGSAGLRFLDADAPDLGEIREALHDIVRDGKRAGEIIRRIRALTKRTELPREKLDLNETILDVLALVGDEAKKNSVTIRTQFADDVFPVHGDRVQLQQVLLNLVMNAIQAMSSVEDRERRLAITTQNVDGGRVQVTVEDSGTGLDPEKIAKIFEPFYTTKSGGMGMGLSICRSILQNHGGRLWATTNEGPGASFHFTLPKHQDENQKAGAAAD